jgi:TPP-dependent pyruvate/acetoin dehydrogenase alpha subunit
VKISREQVLNFYKTMTLVREFELKVREVFRSGSMPGFTHLYVGEEAVVTGVCANLQREDYVTSTHRGHGHALAKGLSPREVLAELLGKVGGSSGGRGGSMHIYDPINGFLGTNGVVAANIPIAVGAALSTKLRKSGQAVVCFFGDGAVNNGAFHEGLNMAKTWDLPVVFICENNLYATETPFRDVTKNVSVASRAAAYHMPGVAVDGNDVVAVYENAREALGRARRGEGPTLLECLTYRWYGHHEGDPGTSYRNREEVETWKKRDPIKKLREGALASHRCELSDFQKIEREIKQLIEEAVEFALDSPQPREETALDHVLCN